MERQLFWFKFKDRLNRKWEVWFSTPSVDAYLDAAYGVCIPRERKIVLDIRQDVETQDATAFHELLHAALDERDMESGEEDVVRLVTKPLWHILSKGLGFSLPPKPALWAKMRASAIKKEGQR